jgi:hypothetical protein
MDKGIVEQAHGRNATRRAEPVKFLNQLQASSEVIADNQSPELRAAEPVKSAIMPPL